MAKPTYIGFVKGYNAKVDPEVAHKEIEAIRRHNKGSVTADDVVERARPKDAPLHAQIFDRGQRDAAEEYYRSQARGLLRAVVVTYEETEETGPVRAFVTVSEERGDHGRVACTYGSMREAMHDQDQREYVFARALRELHALRRKYSQIRELAAVWDQVDMLEAAP